MEQQHAGTLFYSYNLSDDALCQQLARTLRPLVREAHLSEWVEYRLLPGADVVRAKQQGWKEATLILLLLSPAYLASETCYQEMLNALERQQRGEVHVLSILLRPCDRSAYPLATVRCLPSNGQAVTSWRNRQRAFVDIAQEIRQLIGLPVVVSGGRGQLPRVRDVGLDQLRVHAAQVDIPYIERDQQDKLTEAMEPGRAVLVVGHSMSGKTRLVVEAVKRKFPDALLLAAESGKMLRKLFDGGLDPEGLVVWLDDLERFLGVDGLTADLLDRLIIGGAIVVATIRTLQRETYRPNDKLQPPEWKVIQRFSEISLQRRLTEHELRRVQAAVTNPGVFSAVDHYGLAEYLGAGPEALDKFEKGEITNPIGNALVRAAIDLRRTGLIRPVSQQVLVTALPTYLTDRPDLPRNKKAIEKGLAWAIKKINETVALLDPDYTDINRPVFKAFDYLLDQYTYTNTSVPAPMWSIALEQAEPAELVAIGSEAWQADKPTISERAWRQAMTSNDAGSASAAAFNLGLLLLYHQSDLEGAKEPLQKAVASGYVGIASKAAIHLGDVLLKQGDLEGAEYMYLLPAANDDPDEGPLALLKLGAIYVKQGRLERAKSFWQRAEFRGLGEVVPQATFNLGVLCEMQGDPEGAKEAFQQAAASGYAHIASKAALRLGALLQQQGNLEGAKVAYHQVIASNQAETVSKAMVNLGLVLRQQEDLEGAKMAFQQAIEGNDATVIPLATFGLGVVLGMQGNLAEAKAAYQQVIASSHPEWAPKAMVNLGEVFREQGNLAEAKAAYQQAIASGQAPSASLALFNLGELLEMQGNLAEAKAAYQQAIASGQAPSASLAAQRLKQMPKNIPPPTSL